MLREHGVGASTPGAHILTLLRELAADAPDRPAVSCGDHNLTRGQLVGGVNALAQGLLRLGVTDGSVVAICLRNSTEFVQSVLATYTLGAIPFPVPAEFPHHRRAGVIELARPSLVIGLGPKESAGFPALPVDLLSSAVRQLPNGTQQTPVMPPAARITASGGSTGTPKLILTTAAPTAEAMLQIAAALRMPHEAAVLTPAPFCHSGPFVTMLAALLTGNHLLTTGAFDAAETLRLVESHRVAHLYLWPTMMQRILRLPENVRRAADLSSLQTLYHVGAPCSQWLKEAFIEWVGADKILESYGTTEAIAATLINGDDWLSHRGSVGRPVLGEISVRDTEGRTNAPEVPGELWMRRRPGTPPSYRYIGVEARTAGDGWQSLGDIGFVDADGFVYVIDRQSDVIRVDGSTVHPAEVEGAIESHPCVLSSAVVGLPDDDHGQIIHAFVELTEPVTDEQLLDHLRCRLVREKLPRSFERVDGPLRSESGKVCRSELRAEKLAGPADRMRL